MQELDFRFIGTGNAFAPGGLCWNGFVANGKYLFEAPPQALMSLNSMGIDPNELDAVLLSHHHGDHFLGLPFLVLHWKYMGRTRPVQIVGPPGTKELSEDIFSKVYPGLFKLRFDIEWVSVEPGKPVRAAGLEIEAVPAQHDPKLEFTLGYLVDLNGRRFGYTGDSALCDGVLDLARQSEVLVTECASRAEVVPVHMNLVDDMPKVRAAMKPEANLILTHLGADIDENGLDRTVVARDFGRYTFA